MRQKVVPTHIAKLALPGVVFTIVSGVVASTAHASALRSMSEYEASKAFAANPMYRWAGAVKATTAPVFSELYASCVAVAPDIVLGAAHFTPGPTSQSVINEIVFGANYRAVDAVRVPVASWQRFPGYISGDANTVDLGFYRTRQLIPGFKQVTTFGSIPVDAIGSMVDYGNIGDPTTGETPSLGDRMGGNARRSTSPTSAYPESKYDFFDFANSTSSTIPLNVKGLNFSSGSPWFNAQGQLAGLSIAGTPGVTIGNTVMLDLTLPEVQSWLQPIIADSWQRYYSTFTPGDANTDGAVNFSDLLTLAQHYGQTSGASWPDGDFNFDAAVNFTDLLALAQNYGSGAGVVTGAPDNFAADWQLAQSLVPEPSTAIAVGAFATCGLRRRTRSML